MLTHPWILAAIGGALIGLASLFLLWTNGRIAGISGILSGLIRPNKRDFDWRLAFTLGLIGGGILLVMTLPSTMPGDLTTSSFGLVAAGLLVGFGTRLGSGCTSGHGVCGMSRFSRRSFVAVATFMSAGVLTVTLMRLAGGTI